MKILMKFKKIVNQNRNFYKLSEKEREFLRELFISLYLSSQDLKKLIDLAIDLKMWREGSIIEIVPKIESGDNKKATKQKFFRELESRIEKFRLNKNYSFTLKKPKREKIKITQEKKDSFGFGLCPVASPKTRCCNLLTLDAVESCVFDCSYCSIQSFYNQNRVIFDENFSEKLQNLKLDPNEIYHIGTGQSSDSLMWGNRYGVLDALVEFAKKNRNVILELKSKSDNISYFLENEIPKNIILTWSLNPQIVIDNEEHLTASLEERLNSAKKVAKRGIKVGFHFHPMVYFKGWREEYKKIFDYLLENFSPKEVILISFGTLTFIKPVIKKIRTREFESKILQMPLVDSDGKFSYPKEIKLEMFKFAFNSLKEWRNEVFFYICMENHNLWKEVFGYEYPTNETFEMDMKLNYISKIRG